MRVSIVSLVAGLVCAGSLAAGGRAFATPVPAAVPDCGHTAGTGYGPLTFCNSLIMGAVVYPELVSTFSCNRPLGNYYTTVGSAVRYAGSSISSDDGRSYQFYGGPKVSTGYGPTSYGEQRWANPVYGPLLRWGNFNFNANRFFPSSSWQADLGQAACPGLPPPSFSGATGKDDCSNVNRADNRTHTFFYSGLTTAMRDQTDWARTQVYDPTDVNTSLDARTSTTDVVVFDANYTDYCGATWHNPTTGEGVVGQGRCVSLTGAGSCEQFELRYDTSFTDTTTVANRRGLACHEMGHTLGLMHRSSSSNSCMRQGYPKPQNLDAFDRAQLNAAY